MTFTKFKSRLFQRKRRLQVDIFLIFILFFLLSTLSIVFYNYISQSRAQLDLAFQLISKTEENLVTNVEHYLRPNSLTNMMTNVFNSQNFNWSNTVETEKFMRSVISFYPHLVRLRIADQQGHYLQEIRVMAGQKIEIESQQALPAQTQFITSIMSKYKNEYRTQWLFVDSKGHLLKKTFTVAEKSPRQDMWYQGGSQHPDSLWIALNHAPILNKTLVSVAYPILDRYGKTIGVVNTELTAESLDNFLKQFLLGNFDNIFIVNDTGRIIALQGLTNPRPDINSQNLNITNMDVLGAPHLAYAYHYYKSTADNRFIFSSHGRKFLAEFTHFFQDTGENWDVGLVVPVNVYVGILKKTTKLSLLFSLAILAVGIIVIIYIARTISRPIVKLTREMHNITKFRLDDPIKVNSQITEVKSMVTALAAMKASFKSFSRYVPTELVRLLIQKGEIAEIGTQKKMLTFLFTDIADFTEIVEATSPEALGAQLSDYLEQMTQVIKENHGTIDKYIGDAIMSFWGAPTEDANQIINACRTALYCQRKLIDLNKLWHSQGRPSFPTRFGLHAGFALVGNLGSSDRLNYTAIGESVNIAANLESINKKYCTQIIVSEVIYQQAQHLFLFRPLEYLAIRGRSKNFIIYELLGSLEGKSPIAATEAQIELAQLTHLAFAARLRNNLQEAKQRYQDILAKFPEDEVANMFCRSV